MGDYRNWAGDGWLHDDNDKHHAWAGHVAKLCFKMGSVESDLIIEVDLIPLVARGVKQELYVFINGAFVAFWPIETSGIQSAHVEAMVLQPGDWLMTFLMPRAICPRDIGVSKDERTLGIAFRSLSLTAAR